MPAKETYQMTRPAPIIWAYLDKPKPAGNYDARYEVTFLLDEEHPDFKAIKALAAHVAKEGIGKVEGAKMPFKRGDKEADAAKEKNKDREFLRGKVLLQGHSNPEIKNGPKKGEALTPPRIKAYLNKEYVDLSAPEMRPGARKYFYSGAMAIGTFTFTSYDGGVSCWVNEVLSLNTGDRIKTGRDDEARYGESVSAYLGHVSAKDPTAGAEAEPEY